MKYEDAKNTLQKAKKELEESNHPDKEGLLSVMADFDKLITSLRMAMANRDTKAALELKAEVDKFKLKHSNLIK